MDEYTVEIILVVVGLVLLVLLTVLFYILFRRHERRLKQGDRYDKSKHSQQSVVLSNFEVPPSYRTVKAQRPFLRTEKYGVYSSPSSFEVLSGLSTPETSMKSRDGDNVESSGESTAASVASLASYQLSVSQRMAPKKWSSTPDIAARESAETFKTLRRVSQGVLGVQGGAAAVQAGNRQLLGDLRLSHSGAGSVSGDSATSDVDDQESEVFNSTVIGAGKRRVGERRKEGSIKAKYTYKKSGKVSFTTLYSAGDSCLTVHLIRVFNLAAKAKASRINPFVRMYLLPGKLQAITTRYKRATKEPLFHEEVKFINLSPEDLEKHLLKIKVYNHGRLKKHALLGEVDIALSSVNTSNKEMHDVDLFMRRSQSSLTLIGVDLCHHAAFSKLEVIIQDIKDLPLVGIGAPNPYVNVSLFKQGTVEHKETTTKRSARSPSFQESLEFVVHTDVQLPISTYSLVVTVMHRSVVGKDDVLGHVIFSLESPQKSAAAQWLAVQDGPHKHHQRKHNLLDPDEL